MDNRAYFSQKFVDDFIALVVRITSEGLPVNGTTIRKYYPQDGNASSRATGARDFGLIDEESNLGSSASLYADGILPYHELAFELMCKRNTSKSLQSHVKPVVVLCKYFDLMDKLDIEPSERFITVPECFEFLCAVTDYSEINNHLVHDIVNSRSYKDSGPHIPIPRISTFSNSVYLSSLFSCLNDTSVFKFGLQKSILTVEDTSKELIGYIAAMGDRISLAPYVDNTKVMKSELYTYLCDNKNGFLEIIPSISISDIPNDVKSLYEYLFGIGDDSRPECVKINSYGIYKPFFKVRHLVFERIGLDNPVLKEALYQFDFNNRYLEKYEDGITRIMPFGDSYGNLYIK
jgi:hypothetical protein